MDFNTLFHIDTIDEPAIRQAGAFKFLDTVDSIYFL